MFLLIICLICIGDDLILNGIHHWMVTAGNEHENDDVYFKRDYKMGTVYVSKMFQHLDATTNDMKNQMRIRFNLTAYHNNGSVSISKGGNYVYKLSLRKFIMDILEHPSSYYLKIVEITKYINPMISMYVYIFYIIFVWFFYKFINYF